MKSIHEQMNIASFETHALHSFRRVFVCKSLSNSKFFRLRVGGNGHARTTVRPFEIRLVGQLLLLLVLVLVPVVASSDASVCLDRSRPALGTIISHDACPFFMPNASFCWFENDSFCFLSVPDGVAMT